MKLGTDTGFRATAGAWVLAFALAGCENVDYIEIRPQNLILKTKTDSIWLQAKAMSHTGVHYSRTHVGWGIKDPGIATVDEKGLLKPVKSGRTEVVATAAGVMATAPVEVLFAEKMTVEPKEVKVVEGGPPAELKVRVFDYLGRELKERTTTFKSLNKDVVSIGQNAVFGLAPGEAEVEVRCEDLSQKVKVKVEPDKRKK